VLLGSTLRVAFAEGKDAAYYCVAELAGGIAYDEKQRKWQSTTFNVTQKFELRLKYLQTRPQKQIYGEFDLTDYAVTVTKPGDDPRQCSNYYTGSAEIFVDRKTITVWPGVRGDPQPDLIKCEYLGEQLIFSMKTKRFLSIYTYGYLDGKDRRSDTPSISAGTCTKID
jgi:hypothetical protein